MIISDRNIKQIVNYVLIFVIVFVFSGMFYNYGMSRGIAKQHRPVYVKYETVSNTKNLEKILIKSEILLTEQQFIDFTTNLKIKNKEKQ